MFDEYLDAAAAAAIYIDNTMYATTLNLLLYS